MLPLSELFPAAADVAAIVERFNRAMHILSRLEKDGSDKNEQRQRQKTSQWLPRCLRLRPVFLFFANFAQEINFVRL
jgi:hypothetical protein